MPLEPGSRSKPYREYGYRPDPDDEAEFEEWFALYVALLHLGPEEEKMWRHYYKHQARRMKTVKVSEEYL